MWVAPDFPSAHDDWTLMVNSVCLAWVLLAGGLVLHASVVELDGRCHVFTGKSGAGKSTIAHKLARWGCRVANDQTVLFPEENGWTIQATSRQWGERKSVVDAVHLIGRASRPERRRLSAGEGLPGLMSNVILWPAHRLILDWVLERSLDLVTRTEVFELKYGLEHIGPGLLEG